MPFNIVLELNIPASTLVTAPKKVTKDLPPGVVIDEITLHVPAGHQGVVPVFFEANGGLLFPTTGAEYRLDDAAQFVVYRKEGTKDLRFEVSTQLALVGYNEDAVNAHKTRAFVRGRYAEEQ